jgi:diaminohydroxyphosphoribosylaminopyrimidine deaminase / 5-amino-6-(5-phosphoribosylamino)uracil reductase
MNASASSSTASTTAADAAFMDYALQLAARGVALASPNPMVGAVLVREGKTIGEGFHTYDGIRHAEIVALDSAAKQFAEKSGDLGEAPAGSFVGRAFRHDIKPPNPSGVLTPEAVRVDNSAASGAAQGATLYINLEPCCHTGRTGPCTKAMIAAGVARVVAAMPDPNPSVAGRGFRELRAAGIEVAVGLREAEARRLNEAFARWIVSRKPLVTLKSALTLDGQLVLPGSHARAPRKNSWITSPESRAEVQTMRHATDALLTGIGTILADDPLLTDRTGLPRRRKLLRVVMDSRLRLPLRSKLVRSADGDVLVFTRAKEDSPNARALRRAGIEVARLSGGRGTAPDLRAAIEALGRRGILSVLLEAGATLNSAALAVGIVDKMRVFFAPKIAGFGVPGPAAKKTGAARGSSGLSAAQSLRDITMAQFGIDFAFEGYLRDVYRTR